MPSRALSPAPEGFRRAVASLRPLVGTGATRPAGRGQPGVALREVAAPPRLAPYAHALAAEVAADGERLAGGHFIVLHDPDGQPGWSGRTRIVGYVEAAVDDAMGNDPLLAEVGWAWLEEALAARAAGHRAAGGTVTRTASARFGTMADGAEACEVELRCSWTPDGEDLAPHLAAYCDVVRAMAGLPPAG